MTPSSAQNSAPASQNGASAPGTASPTPLTVTSSPLLRAAGFVKGETVFDTASGQDVTVVDAARTAGLNVTSIYVRRVDGSVVPRHADELIRRPTPPAASR